MRPAQQPKQVANDRDVDQQRRRFQRGGAVCRLGVVRLNLTRGFSFGRPVLHLSTEANDPLAATLEGATIRRAAPRKNLRRDATQARTVRRIV